MVIETPPWARIAEELGVAGFTAFIAWMWKNQKSSAEEKKDIKTLLEERRASAERQEKLAAVVAGHTTLFEVLESKRSADREDIIATRSLVTQINDKFNILMGERAAEARAKER